MNKFYRWLLVFSLFLTFGSTYNLFANDTFDENFINFISEKVITDSKQFEVSPFLIGNSANEKTLVEQPSEFLGNYWGEEQIEVPQSFEPVELVMEL